MLLVEVGVVSAKKGERVGGSFYNELCLLEAKMRQRTPVWAPMEQKAHREKLIERKAPT